MRERCVKTARFGTSNRASLRLALLVSVALGACGISQRTVEERSGSVGSGGAGQAGATGKAASPAFGGIAGGKQDPATAGFYVPFEPPHGVGGGTGGGPGVAVGGKASGFGCGHPSPIPPNCPAAPAPLGLTGGAGGESACSALVSPNAGQAGAKADDAPSLPESPRLLIDDLEDGDISTFSVLDAQGDWFTANDGSGQQFPSPCAAVSVTETGGHAMHTYGHDFISAAGGYSLLGFHLNSDQNGCKKAVDASQYTGIEFQARGQGVLRFFIGTTAINPPADLGSCEVACYDAHGLSVSLNDAWGLYRIPFRYLSQEGWGSIAPFDPSQILSVMWSAKVERGSIVPSGCFDFWVDEVAFYRE